MLFKTWWPVLAVLAVLGAFWTYGAIEARKARIAAQSVAKIEKLEGANKSMTEAIQIRNLQNEIRNNRPDTPTLVIRLRDGSF